VRRRRRPGRRAGGGAKWEGAGSSPAVSAVAVACAVTRTHHPCKAVCKRKNLGVSQLRPSFIGSSVLSDAVQRRTMLYKTRYKYRYIYRGPNVFNTEWSGLPGLGDRAFEVHRLAGSTPVTSTEMTQWRVISPSPGSRDSLVAVFLTVEINSEQNRLSPPTPLILNGESEGFSPLYGKITEMTSFWDNLPQPFFILAPMEAVTDVVFRHVVKQAGAPDVFFTEFANATGWVHAGDKAIAGRLIKTDDEHPLVAQIWGGEPGDMEQFATHCAKLGFDGIDINMGCPAKSAIKSGGAALIRRPDVAVAAIAAAKTAGLPVSVKTRLGYTYVDEWREWLTTLLQQDIANLTIHLRTKKEMSKVPAHFELIDDIIKLRDDIAPQTLLTINGDIRDRTHGEELFAAHPGLNGIMIGRGIFSNPFCFRKGGVSSEIEDKRVIVDGAAPTSEQISDFSEEGADRLVGPASSDPRGPAAAGGGGGGRANRHAYVYYITTLTSLTTTNQPSATPTKPSNASSKSTSATLTAPKNYATS